ncbi:MAG: polysaccharide biosynthesis C-terminal domain-containing protein [Comamonadaceae bacterium]|nr:polysaccharide biosynthesis C-terminal domain-containing protein [Comamonadaceae bacterium]
MFGLQGAIWSIVVAGVLYWYLNAWMLRAMLEIPLGEVMRQLRRPLAATAFMIAVVAGLAAVTPLDVLAASASGGALVVKTLMGGAVYCGACTRPGGSRAGPAGIERRLAQLWSR